MGAGLALGGATQLLLVQGLLDGSNELLNRDGDDEHRMEILRLALDDEHVLGIHQLRARVSGLFLHVQMHMELDPKQTLTLAHGVAEAAEQRIQRHSLRST